MYGMLQLPPDRFLALEAAEEGRIALELHEGDLQGHGLAGLAGRCALKIEAMPLRLISSVI